MKPSEVDRIRRICGEEYMEYDGEPLDILERVMKAKDREIEDLRARVNPPETIYEYFNYPGGP
jgi:hypothetical protein